MRKVIAIALMIAAVAVAVSGYSLARVSSDDAAAWVKTQDALLSVKAGDGAGNTGIATYTADEGSLKLDFGQGFRNASRGFQDRSEYTFTDLVKVTNNSNDPVRVAAASTENVRKSCGLYKIAWALHGDSQHDFADGPTSTLQPGQSFNMSFYFSTAQVPSWSPQNCAFTIDLDSTVVAAQ